MAAEAASKTEAPQNVDAALVNLANAIYHTQPSLMTLQQVQAQAEGDIDAASKMLKLGDRVGAIKKVFAIINTLDVPTMISVGTKILDLMKDFGILSLPADHASDVIVNLLADKDSQPGAMVQALARGYATESQRADGRKLIAESSNAAAKQMHTQAIDVATATEFFKALLNWRDMIRGG